MSHFDFGHFLPIRWVRSSRSVQAVSSGLHGLLPESGPRPPSPLRPPPFRRFRSPLPSWLRRCGSAASAYFAALPTATKGRGGRDSRRKRGGRVEDGERGGGEDGRGRERDETSSGSGAKFGLGVPDGQWEQGRRKGSGEAERGAGRSHPQGSVGGRAKVCGVEVDFGVLGPPSDPVFKSIYRVSVQFRVDLIYSLIVRFSPAWLPAFARHCSPQQFNAHTDTDPTVRLRRNGLRNVLPRRQHQPTARQHQPDGDILHSARSNPDPSRSPNRNSIIFHWSRPSLAAQLNPQIPRHCWRNPPVSFSFLPA